MEFYFQDQLRWAYGFDNPNKAGALVASLLPLVWILVSEWLRVKKSVLKWIGVFAGTVILCAGWWLLFKTYSRGGIVAALVAFGYIGFCSRYALKQNWLLIFACSIAITGLFIFTQAGERSLSWIGNHEGSVENRFTLWKGGLEMLAANPRGVGSGKSGELYMQWYQPPDMTARYRTLVNSYLTFAVEQGLWIFGTGLFLAAAIWNIGGGVQSAGFSRDAVVGMRSSVLAFAVAGFFSTTMEEMKLWAVPIFCAAFLVIASLVRPRWNLTTNLKRPLIATFTLCGILYATGFLLARNEPLRIALQHQGTESATVEPTRRDGRSAPRSLRVIVDEEVMGHDYGKLVRRLALETGMRIMVSDFMASVQPGEIILASGESVNRLRNSKNQDLVLLAPAKIGETEAAKILLDATSVKLLLPGFDEDGRVAFWNDVVKNAGRSAAIRTDIIEGVGTQTEWGWDCVIGYLKN